MALAERGVEPEVHVGSYVIWMDMKFGHAVPGVVLVVLDEKTGLVTLREFYNLGLVSALESQEEHRPGTWHWPDGKL